MNRITVFLVAILSLAACGSDVTGGNVAIGESDGLALYESQGGQALGLSNIQAFVGANSALISATTSVPATFKVVYMSSVLDITGQTDSTLVTDHEIVLPNLKPGMLYKYQVDVCDRAITKFLTDYKHCQWSATLSFTTLAQEPARPALSNPVVSAGAQAAVLTFTTDVPTRSIVEYGTTSALELPAIKTLDLKTTHSVTLPNLSTGTRYLYEVTVLRTPATTRASGVQSFSTLTGEPVPECANANVLCVAADGSKEYTTIQAAVNALGSGSAAAGKTVLVYPGHYAGFSLNGKRGTAASPIIIRGLKNPDGTRGAHIDSKIPGASVADFVWVGDYPATATNYSDYITVEGFEIGPDVSDPVYAVVDPGRCVRGLMFCGGQHMTIRDNEVHNCRGGIYTTDTIHLEISDNVVHDIGYDGFDKGTYQTGGSAPFGKLEGLTYARNIVYRSCEANVQIHPSLTGVPWTKVVAEGNVIFDARRDDAEGCRYGDGSHTGVDGNVGFSLGGIQDSIFRNNLVYDNPLAQMSLRGWILGVPSKRNVIVNNVFAAENTGSSYVLKMNEWNSTYPEKPVENYFFNNVLMGGTSRIMDEPPGNFVDKDVSQGGSNIRSLYNATLLGSLFRNPFGSDMFARDYRIKAGSLAYNKGVAAYLGKTAPSTDILGVIRPQVGVYDIGAYELTQ